MAQFLLCASFINRLPINLLSRVPTQTCVVQCNFEEVVDLCERVISGEALSLASVPALLRKVYADDEAALWHSERKLLADVSCLRPIVAGDSYDELHGDFAPVDFQAAGTNAGRLCQDGCCSSRCSRVSVSGFASDEECAALRRGIDILMGLGFGEVLSEGQHNLDLNAAAMAGDARSALLLLRLMERLRRAVANEFGVKLQVRSAFVSRIGAGAEQQAYGALHVDEGAPLRLDPRCAAARTRDHSDLELCPDLFSHSVVRRLPLLGCTLPAQSGRRVRGRRFCLHGLWSCIWLRGAIAHAPTTCRRLRRDILFRLGECALH